MSTVQKELITTINGLSEDTAQLILAMIKQVVVPLEKKNETKQKSSTIGKRKLGIARGETLVADGYDFDECNDEVEKMFWRN